MGQGVAFGGRLDTIYVLRGDAVVQVGNSSGSNEVGATPTDELYNAQGRPIGGGVIPAVFEGTLPNIPPPDGGGNADGGAQDLSPYLDDGGNPVDLNEPPDLAEVDASATDDAGVSDGGPAADLANGDGGPPTSGPGMESSTKRVRFLDWLMANFEFRATPIDDKTYTVYIKGDHLIPNGLYSAWAQYTISLPNPILYAIAPLGGLPTAFIAGDDGKVEITWKVSARMFEQLQQIPNGIAVGNSGIPPVVTPATAIVVTLMYHSSGQLNGNGSIPSVSFDTTDGGIATEVPPLGTVGIPGHVGVDVHPHVSTFPMQTVARQHP